MTWSENSKYKLEQFRVLPETMRDFRAFSDRTKVPVAVMVRDALDVFSILLRGCTDYPNWQKRMRAAISAGESVK